MARWTEEQRSQLRREPIDLDSDVWFYETPEGLACYVARPRGAAGEYSGTLMRSTLEAYLRHVQKVNDDRAQPRDPNAERRQL